LKARRKEMLLSMLRTSVAHDSPESVGGGCATQEPQARAASLLESRANFGVLGGMVITLLGGAIGQQSR
jgi:hypothetical protein